MQYNFSGFLLCDHCEAPITWPIWARYEGGDHRPFCWRCYTRLDDTFTADQAICQALIIIGVYQGAHPIGGKSW